MPSPTWRELIADASVGIDEAKARRREVFRAAHAAGFSQREIAKAAGISASRVNTIIGRAERLSLDAPAPEEVAHGG